MSKQIALRLPDELVAFVDAQVDEGVSRSRGAVVALALERERQRSIAARDAEIVASSETDRDLTGLAEYVAMLPSDLP